MSHNKRCTPVVKSKKHYDVILGKMVGEETIGKVVPADITPVTTQLKNTFGDKLKDVTKVVHIRQYKEKVDYILIDGQPFYIVEQTDYGRRGRVFYVSEVKNGKNDT